MKRYIEWIIRHRKTVIVLTLIATVLAISQARNLKIIIDPNTMLPRNHPHVVTTELVEKTFGMKNLAVIGITPKQGDIYQPAVLAKIQHMTSALLKAKGILQEDLLSLSARRAKDIMGTAEGMEVRQLMPFVPENEAQMQALRSAVQRNSAYINAIVSKDGKTAAVIAMFKDIPGGFRAIEDQVEAIADHERDDSVEIFVSGLPSFLSHIEKYSERMGFLLPIAIIVLGLVLFEAFRTKQGMFLPLVTAILAVAWGLGVMGLSGIPMDVFNATTPILILAVATGHAVQMLKRYYEEYFRLREAGMAPQEANNRAVVESLAKVGPVMIAAGMVAAIGFFSLMVFEISTVRTFGVFTGVGILAAMMLEMTFIPALRSVLKPPSDSDAKREHGEHVWARITGAIARWVTGPQRKRVYVGAVLFVALAAAGMSQVEMNNSTKSYFSQDLQFERDDRTLNERMGGANTMYVLIEGAQDDDIKNPKVLQAMDELQRLLEQKPEVGKTMSMADFIKRMNQAMHGDDPAYYKVPESQELISQYLLLYSMSGEPGDFDGYVDYGYRMANITLFLKVDSTEFGEQVMSEVNAFASTHFPPNIKVRFGGLAEAVALNQTMVEGKILNIAQIAAVVFVISSLVFRSLLAGLLVLLPLLLTVLANFGLMGWSGIYLNIATSLTSAMAVGIGADYAIYFIFRLREELDKGVDELTAVRNVIATAGKAILFVAIAVAAGYGVLLTSYGFNLHKWLSILIGVAMIVSALAALILIPALILTFRPNFIFRRKA